MDGDAGMPAPATSKECELPTMDDGSRILWCIIAALFCFAICFAVAETSFASVSKVRIRAACERGDKRARKALKVLESFDRAVTTILIGTNITHLGVASIVTVLVIRIWGPGLVSVSTIITTIAVFVLSEMLPKSVTKRYCEPLALATASPLLFFMKLFAPISCVLTAIGQGAARLLGEQEEVTVTEEELHDIIETMAEDGMLDEDQSELISSALDVGDIAVGSILTPCAQMEALSVHTRPEKVRESLLAHSHSRYPVYDGDVDHIIGTLRMRRYLKAWRKQGAPGLRSLTDPLLFVEPGMNVSELIREMNRQKVSLAIVQDEAGHTCGMLTVEDALEELVSDMDLPEATGG